ncbi:MAG: site-specific integrase [Planctomycetes bacterium]|nr:site-specific integrase [Planctomycetota bacterium]
MSRKKITRDRDPGRGTLRRGKNKKGQFVWYGDWVDAEGKRHRVALSADKRVAETRLANLIKDRDESLGGQVPMLDVAIAEIMVAYMEAARLVRSASHIDRLGRLLPCVIERLGVRVVKEISRARLNAYRARRHDEGLSNATINRELSSLRAMLTWAVDNELLGFNPMVGLKRLPEGEKFRKRPRRAATDDEAARIIAAAEAIDVENAAFFAAEKSIRGKTKGERYALRERRVYVPQAPFWRALLLTGARWNEAATIIWSDISFENRLLTLRAENTKTGKRRELPLHKAVIADLHMLKEVQRKARMRDVLDSDRVFLSPEGTSYLDLANTTRRFHRIIKRAGIEKKTEKGSMTIHSMRHTFCTMLARAGVPLIEAQKLMGHSDPKLTAAIYSHVEAEDLRPAIDRLPGLGGEVKEGNNTYMLLSFRDFLAAMTWRKTG